MSVEGCSVVQEAAPVLPKSPLFPIGGQKRPRLSSSTAPEEPSTVSETAPSSESAANVESVPSTNDVAPAPVTEKDADWDWKAEADAEKWKSRVLEVMSDAGDHSNVMRMMTSRGVDAPSPSETLPPATNANLMDWIRATAVSVPASVRLEITRQLFSGLAFLHDKNVVHMNITATGMLMFASDGWVKISDFSQSRIMPTKPMPEHWAMQRSDVWRMTEDVVMNLWLARRFHRTLEPDVRSEFAKNGASEEMLKEAETHLQRHAMAVTNWEKQFESEPNWWQEQFKEKPELEKLIFDLMAWEFKHPSESTESSWSGMAVPEEAFESLRWGLMMGPMENLTASRISAAWEKLVTEEQRAEWRAFAKEHTT